MFSITVIHISGTHTIAHNMGQRSQNQNHKISMANHTAPWGSEQQAATFQDFAKVLGSKDGADDGSSRLKILSTGHRLYHLRESCVVYLLGQLWHMETGSTDYEFMFYTLYLFYLLLIGQISATRPQTTKSAMPMIFAPLRKGTSNFVSVKPR